MSDAKEESAADISGIAAAIDITETCKNCHKEIVNGKPHGPGCAAIVALERSVARVHETGAVEVTVAAASATLPQPLKAKTPPPTPELKAVTATAVPELGHVAKKPAEKQHSDFVVCDTHTETTYDEDDGEIPPETRRQADVAGGEEENEAACWTCKQLEYPARMNGLAGDMDTFEYPREQARRMVECYGYMAAANALLFIVCVAGSQIWGTVAYYMGVTYWDFGSDVDSPRIAAHTMFRAGAAVAFLVACMLCTYMAIHMFLQCNLCRMRSWFVKHVARVVASRYDTVGAIINMGAASLAYPILAALCGERDGLRMFLLAGLAIAWQLALYCSDYFASPARSLKSEQDGYEVQQQTKHGRAFWYLAALLQVFVYAPIVQQSSLALPNEEMNPQTHSALRMVTWVACFSLDTIKLLYNTTCIATGCLCNPLQSTRFITNTTLSFAVFVVISIAGTCL